MVMSEVVAVDITWWFCIVTKRLSWVETWVLGEKLKEARARPEGNEQGLHGVPFFFKRIFLRYCEGGGQVDRLSFTLLGATFWIPSIRRFPHLSRQPHSLP